MPETNQKQETVLQSVIARSKVIDAIVVQRGAMRLVPDLLSMHFDDRKVFLVADDNTRHAAGARLTEILEQQGFAVTSEIFPGTPRLKGAVENGEILVARMRESGGIPVAVGSGVINDLVKYAAFQLGIPYVSVATAASMDGYASAGSPLTVKGFKHTIPCAAPRVMVADLDVITAAPKEMASWGYGDLAGKLPAGADWLIADALGIEPLDDAAWPLVQTNLKEWLSNPAGLANGDPEATGGLFTGLVAAGIAMEVHGSSRPASGADHQVAHLWEMDGLKLNGLPVSHGTCVAVGALTILSLYEWLLDQDLRSLDAADIVANRRRLPDLETEIARRFPSPDIAERAIKETQAKYVGDDELAGRIARIGEVWPDLCRRLADYLPAFEEMREMLATAGVATSPAEIGIDRDYHRQTLIAARLIRRRYTILDFLEETGRLEAAVEHVFSHSGRWG